MKTRMLVVEATLCLALSWGTAAVAAAAKPSHKAPQPHIVCNLKSCHVVGKSSSSSGHRHKSAMKDPGGHSASPHR